jgi:hypothetical protein
MYDTVTPCRVPDWIAETVETRNVVNLRLGVRDKLDLLVGHCKLYKKDAEAFLRGEYEEAYR